MDTQNYKFPQDGSWHYALAEQRADLIDADGHPELFITAPGRELAMEKLNMGGHKYQGRKQRMTQGSCSFKAPGSVFMSNNESELTVKCLGVLCTFWPELQLLSRLELPTF